MYQSQYNDEMKTFDQYKGTIDEQRQRIWELEDELSAIQKEYDLLKSKIEDWKFRIQEVLDQ